MQRREFCRLSAVVFGALGLPILPSRPQVHVDRYLTELSKKYIEGDFSPLGEKALPVLTWDNFSHLTHEQYLENWFIYGRKSTGGPP
jgi:hypothetical protein